MQKTKTKKTLIFINKSFRNCSKHPGKTDKNPLDEIRNDKILGDKKAAHTCIHILMEFLNRSILLLRVKEEKIVIKEADKTIIDSYIEGFGDFVIPWFCDIASLGDPLRCIIGNELMYVCLSTPGECRFIVDIHEDESLFDLILRVKQKLNEITFYDSSALLCRLSAHLPIADPLINLYLQLLYDGQFKQKFMKAFIRFYPSLAPFMKTITSNADKRIMDDFINRVTAQVSFFYLRSKDFFLRGTISFLVANSF